MSRERRRRNNRSLSIVSEVKARCVYFIPRTINLPQWSLDTSLDTTEKSATIIVHLFLTKAFSVFYNAYAL